LLPDLSRLVLSISGAQAAVIWTFTETSCTSTNGGCTGNPGFFPPLPVAVASLTLPDISSSGHYSYLGSTPPTELGDKDFLLIWGAPLTTFTAPVPENRTAFSWDVTFASSPSGPQLNIQFFGDSFSDNITFLSSGFLGSGSIGSDRFIPGCGTFAQCQISGLWSLASVPEPWSVDLLIGSLIAMFGLARSSGRPASPTA